MFNVRLMDARRTNAIGKLCELIENVVRRIVKVMLYSASFYSVRE